MKKFNTQNRAKKDTKPRILIIILIVILIISILFLLGKCSNGAYKLNAPKYNPIYLEDNGGSLIGEAQEKSREELLKALKSQQLIVTDKLNSNITFSSGEIGVIGEWTVENPEENNIIQQAEVYLDELLIAKSTPIYPNQHITGIELLKKVETGEYEIITYINYYGIETKEFISKAGYKIHLTIR